MIEGGGSRRDLVPVAFAEPACDQPLIVHEAFSRDKPHGKLLPAHFQREIDHAFAGKFSGVEKNVQCHGGLAHTGAGRQKDKVGFVETGDGGVHTGQAGGQSGDGGVAGGKLGQTVIDRQNDRGDMLQPLGGTALPQAINALLGQVQSLVGGGGAFPDHIGDGPGGISHLAQKGFVPDDLDILLHVGGGGGDVHELADVVVGGGLVVDPGLLHLIQHSYRVHSLGEVKHGADGLVDLLVLPEIEILRLQLLDDLGDTPLINEDGTQHCLFRLNGVGHLPGKQFVHMESPPCFMVAFLLGGYIRRRQKTPYSAAKTGKKISLRSRIERSQNRAFFAAAGRKAPLTNRLLCIGGRPFMPPSPPRSPCRKFHIPACT